MASGRTSKRNRSKPPVAVRQRSTSWGTVSAVVVVLLFAGGVLGYAIHQQKQKTAADGALAAYTPSETDQDPSTKIPGVQTVVYGPEARKHVVRGQRVAYSHSPPMGGAHEFNWAACTGTVYPRPVRNENMVHALEHGAVWIAYDPAKLPEPQVAELRARVAGKSYLMLSPYPDLDQPISLQSWGHQLKLADVKDPRIDQFIQALRLNQYQNPENGASCDSLGRGQFDQDDPPPYVPAPPASAVDGKDILSEIEAANPPKN